MTERADSLIFTYRYMLANGHKNSHSSEMNMSLLHLVDITRAKVTSLSELAKHFPIFLIQRAQIIQCNLLHLGLGPV